MSTTLATLQSLIAQGESETLELKRSTAALKRAGETHCAFLNGEGGKVLIGVGPDGKLVGQDVADITPRDIAVMLGRFEPPARVEMSRVDVENGRQVIVLEAVPSRQFAPFVFESKPYKRVGSTTTVMSQEEYARLLLERNHRRHRWEKVAGFANAEGGVLILGIEDDHRVTGHQLPPDALAALLDLPRVRLHPPQPQGFVLQHDGHSLIVFDVPNCDVPVRVEGDGFPLRIGDKTMQVSESHIQKLKFRGLVESWESRPSHLRLADLDPALLERARRGAGLIALTDAHRAGRLENARLRAISGLDTLGASALLRRLRDRELLALHAAGPNSYYELGPKAQLPVDAQALDAGTQGLPAKDTQGLRADTQGFDPNAQGLEPGTQGSAPDVTSLIAALPDDLRLELTRLGPKPGAPRLRKVLLDLCAMRWWTPRELVAVLGLKDAANLSRKHLWPLVTEGKLERRHPDNPAHPQQAYRAVGAGAAP